MAKDCCYLEIVLDIVQSAQGHTHSNPQVVAQTQIQNHCWCFQNILPLVSSQEELYLNRINEFLVGFLLYIRCIETVVNFHLVMHCQNIFFVSMLISC